MTVNELIQILQEVSDEGRGDAEVRLAYQPNYPLQSTVDGVCDAAEILDDDGEAPAGDAVYVCEGSQVGYAARALWDNVRC